jgi:hypothetical protein
MHWLILALRLKLFVRSSNLWEVVSTLFEILLFSQDQGLDRQASE